MNRAIVISGGGSKGAFAVGVLAALRRKYPNLHFQNFIGTSTGSLIIPLLATGHYELLENLYSTQTTGNIIKKHNIGNRLNEHSIFDANPLWNLITTYFSDELYEQIVEEQMPLFFTTTCLQTGGLVVFTTRPDPVQSKYYVTESIVNADHFRKAIMASACQPVFMPPIQVNKGVTHAENPNYQYVDGGVREYAGVQMAIDQNATEICTILLSTASPSAEDRQFTALFPILQKTIEIFTEDVAKNDLIIPAQYNEALEYIEAVKRKMSRAGIPTETIRDYFTIRGRESPYEDKRPLKLYTFRPDHPLGGGAGGLEFDPQEMKGMMAAGKKVVSDFIAGVDPADLSWV